MKLSASCIALAMLFTTAFSQAKNARNIDGNQASVNDGRIVLRQLEQQASATASDVDYLARMGGSLRLSRETQIAQLDRIASDINLMGKELNKLQSEEVSIASWERDALTKVLPYLHDAATETDNAIHYFNTNRGQTWTDPYRGNTSKIEQDCEKARNLLRSYLKLDQATREEHKELQNLDMASGS